jgi:hypothetical protein
MNENVHAMNEKMNEMNENAHAMKNELLMF